PCRVFPSINQSPILLLPRSIHILSCPLPFLYHPRFSLPFPFYSSRSLALTFCAPTSPDLVFDSSTSTSSRLRQEFPGRRRFFDSQPAPPLRLRGPPSRSSSIPLCATNGSDDPTKVSRTNANFLMNSRSKIAVIVQAVTDN
ncbi:hypothetical protein GQ607_003445, partial [Colletotrichum asianum]